MKAMSQIWVPWGLGLRSVGNIWFFFQGQEHQGKMRQGLVSINLRAEISEGKGFSPACVHGKEGSWHRDGQLYSPFIGDLDFGDRQPLHYKRKSEGSIIH